MAREPYRTHMHDMLTYGSPEPQAELLRRFVIEEAGSSHSDVIARDDLERLYEEVHHRKYARPRFFIEFDDRSGYWLVREGDGSATITTVPTRFSSKQGAQRYADWMSQRRR